MNDMKPKTLLMNIYSSIYDLQYPVRMSYCISILQTPQVSMNIRFRKGYKDSLT